MYSLNEYTFLSADKETEIYVREYVPEGTIKGFIQIAHGVSEHIKRYDDFMKMLAENGYVVAGNDHLGHGQSIAREENMGFFAEENGWAKVVSDMKTLYNSLKKRYPQLSATIFGHSMGSFLTRTYLIKYPYDFDNAIICGTGQQSPLLIKGGSLLAEMECKKHGPRYVSERLQNIAFGAYNNNFKPIRTPYDWLSKNQDNVNKYIEDPLCGGVSTCGLFRDMMTGLKFIGSKDNIAKMNKSLPVFLIAGSMDPVGECGKGVKIVYDRFKAAGISNVTMKLYEDDRHEILNEDDKDQVYADIIAWLKEQE